ncbi:WD repeat-containing protein 97 isoform X3 [Acanthochromis polyacanthus]|uniref:WD repeat-containing protein 97 isoform X3 n=1 Tax=Acanthochromis polyacanthus TaxID=80966 RepID=UPI0022341615|nr:WD repeat-containing protein 97 isoform X3 [Acanthochromis polyacanthus]
MITPGERSTKTTVLPTSPTLDLVSQGTETTKKQTPEKQIVLKQNVAQPLGKIIFFENVQRLFTHGLHRLQHFPCSSPVRFMMYSEASAAFISLHSDNTVCLYKTDSCKQNFSTHLPYMGLTAAKILGFVVGWGPGPVFTRLDSELRPLKAAHDALDIRVCQAAEHSTELVTAGVGNVCVWSVMFMRCKVKIQEGLQHSSFNHMALAPPRSDRPHRAFVACGEVVTVVDLDAGKVLEQRQTVYKCDVTAMVYCSQLDCLIIAYKDLSIRVWSPGWKLRVAFSGHNDVVNSLFYCSELSTLVSSSVDCTIRCWNVEECDAVDCIHTEQKNAPLCIGGTRRGDIFFSFSHEGVDFWTIRTLYTLHCQLRADKGAPLRQILVSSLPAPYPTRVLCVSDDSDITLVASETGAVLTSFKAENKIVCADYCMHKEILLALTEAGTVLQANTLTNPITLMREWEGRGQGPWQQRDCVTENDARSLPIPGPACCLVLYSCVPETERAVEEWRSLQDRRGCSQRNKAALDDDKNKFLIILGQNGGCVSVLKMKDGKVSYRTPAHNGQRVTTVQVYPENNYLLSTGEDSTVMVWRVNPYIRECLTKHLSVHCGQPQVYMAALGPQLALTFQEPNSGFYRLKHFSLLNQSQTDYQPTEGHSDHCTGLCVFPDLEMFVSSSLDKTMHIWNKENHLIRTLQLNAAPECLAYGGFGGELFLGIRGDLYRMNCAKLLPQNYRQTLPYSHCVAPPPDLPIPETEETYNQTKILSKSTDEEESQAIASNQLLTEPEQKESLVAPSMDLAALLQGTVKCKKGKPPSTAQTKKEAFDCYMKKIYGLPLKIKVNLEDTFDESSFYSELNEIRPCDFHTVKKDVGPKHNVPTRSVEKNTMEQNVQLLKKKIPAIEIEVKPPPVKRVIPKKPDIVEEEEEIRPPEVISPVEQPKPQTAPPAPAPPRPDPQPSPRPRFIPMSPAPPPQREPSPEVPTFLKQFAEMEWFMDLFPDRKSIHGILSPEDFSLLLMNHLQTCSILSKIKILAAVQILHSQGLLQNTDKLYQGLIDCLHKFAQHDMSPLERIMLADMLKLLVCLRSASLDLMKTLLTLLAYKKLGLWETVMRILTELGVDEAKQWLWNELESWDSKLQDESDPWKSLYDTADWWLELWISKYKEHNKYLYIRSTANWKPSTFSMVDVLNYFCSVQKEEHSRARSVAPAGRKNTVLLPLYDCSSQPIFRLGETYSMARTRRLPGISLPPLRNRPFLMNFPSFICLPLPRVTLSPFQTYSDEGWVRSSTRRYFIQRHSWVEYYR